MTKNCFLFEGQGAQYPGMGKELWEGSAGARRVFAMAEEVLGVDAKALCFDTDEETLSRTDRAQLAVFTVSMAALAALEERGISGDVFFGFSLGELSAMCAAGMFSLEDGFRIVQKRGELMQRCAEGQKGAMYAVIGLEDAAVEEICAREGGVWAVNYNCPGQLVIAGDEDAAARAAEACLGSGASKAVRLAVAGAFHSPHMARAAQELEAFLPGFAFSLPRGTVYANVTGAPLSPDEALPGYLARQMTSPVLWKRGMEGILADGPPAVYEIGCGKTLTGFLRRIDRRVRASGYRDLLTGENNGIISIEAQEG